MCLQTIAIIPGGAAHCLEYHVYDIGGYFANDKEHASSRSGASSIETDLDGAAAYRSNKFEQLLRVSSEVIVRANSGFSQEAQTFNSLELAR